MASQQTGCFLEVRLSSAIKLIKIGGIFLFLSARALFSLSVLVVTIDIREYLIPLHRGVQSLSALAAVLLFYTHPESDSLSGKAK